MLSVAIRMLTLSGLLTLSREYRVKLVVTQICAISGFSVSLPCNYSHSDSQVEKMLWCSVDSNEDLRCVNPPYVYDSSSHGSSDFVYIGNNRSDCSLSIRNVQFKYSGPYKFRFITNKNRFTGEALTLQVAALQVSLISLSANGTLNKGDSVNLTCQPNCTESSSEFLWFKDNKQLQTSGPILHFPSLTVWDSGTYTCAWKSNYASGSKSFELQVRGVHWTIWKLCLLIAGLILVVMIIAFAIIKKRTKVEASEVNSGKAGDKRQVEEDACTKPIQSSQVRPASEEEEITYSSVIIKTNKPAQKQIHTERRGDDDDDDDFVIYSGIK